MSYGGEQNHAGPEQEHFILPRYLICSESLYFRKQFANTLWSRLRNVRPWILRVFVRWLHKGDIFYDSRRIEPTWVRHFSQDHPAEPIVRSEGHKKESKDHSIAEKESVDNGEPTTWPYSWLFELYLFAAKYEAGRFRLDVQDIIHVKLQEGKFFPSPATLAIVIGDLPEGDTLYQLLARCYCWLDTGCTGEASIARAKSRAAIPSTFAWLVSGMKDSTLAAQNCATCSWGKAGEKCTARDHSETDALNPFKVAACSYHDHRGDREELSRCYWRWLSMTTRIRTIECNERVKVQRDECSTMGFVDT